MKPEIGFMGLLSTENILDDLLFAVENGFDWFELPLDWKQNYNLSDHIIREIRGISKNHGINLIIHTPYYLPTSSLIPEIKKVVFEYVENAIHLAIQLNSNRITIHPGYREMPLIANELSIDSLVENLSRMMEIAKDHNVHLCLENFKEHEMVLCGELSEMLGVVNSVKDLKVTFDVGHSNITKTDPWEYFSAVKNFIMDMHIHDNHGKTDEHNPPGEGNIDFIRLLAECKKTRYYGPFILEIFPYENIIKGKNIFTDLWEKA